MWSALYTVKLKFGGDIWGGGGGEGGGGFVPYYIFNLICNPPTLFSNFPIVMTSYIKLLTLAKKNDKT